MYLLNKSDMLTEALSRTMGGTSATNAGVVLTRKRKLKYDEF